MRSSLNLMSLSARRKECRRMRKRHWSFVLASVLVCLGLVTTQRYLSHMSTLRQQHALESKYEPIGALKSANKILAKQIAAIRDEEQFVLALSKREPTITLLGLLGNAVADGDSHVFLQKIELVNVGLESMAKDGLGTQLDVAGIANSTSAVNAFKETLQESLPFGKIDISSTKEYQLKQQTMQDFSLQCVF
jgi:Tfp pilus assembly protein PilN